MQRSADEELSAWIGHNGGPPLLDAHRPPWGKGAPLGYAAWKKAHTAAWKSAPRDIVLFRLKRAEAAGVSYHDYMLELLDSGRRLQARETPHEPEAATAGETRSLSPAGVE